MHNDVDICKLPEDPPDGLINRVMQSAFRYMYMYMKQYLNNMLRCACLLYHSKIFYIASIQLQLLLLLQITKLLECTQNYSERSTFDSRTFYYSLSPKNPDIKNKIQLNAILNLKPQVVILRLFNKK